MVNLRIPLYFSLLWSVSSVALAQEAATTTTTITTATAETIDECNFVIGDGVGGTEKFVGDANTKEQCAADVRQTEPSADGASWSNGEAYKPCFAEFGSTSVNKGKTWQTCKFNKYQKLKEGFECTGAEEMFGTFPTIQKCAGACAKKPECRFFIYGKATGTQGDKKGQCYWEKISSGSCNDWQADSYDFYELIRPNGGI